MSLARLVALLNKELDELRAENQALEQQQQEQQQQQQQEAEEKEERQLPARKVPKSVAARIQALQQIRNKHRPAIGRCFPLDSQESFTKVLYMMRHGQGYHNLARDDFESGRQPKREKGWWNFSPEYEDAELTEVGIRQAAKTARILNDIGADKEIELVVVSPLRRTCQTAKLAGAGLRTANVPFIGIEDCRERYGLNIPDKRMNIAFVKNKYPFIDFRSVMTEDDVLWKADVRETYEELSQRAIGFANWICARPEKTIMIVAHSVFLSALLNVALDCNESSMAGYVHPGELRGFKVLFST